MTRNVLLLCICLLTLSLASNSLEVVQAQAVNTMTCFTLQNPVTVDGRYTGQDEWQDSLELSLVSYIGQGTINWTGNGSAYIKTKHDNAFLYVLVDFVSVPTANVDDGSWITLDVKHNGGNSLSSDDIGFEITWISGGKTKFGATEVSGGNWVDASVPANALGASSLNAENDPHSTVAHSIYEFRIPTSSFTGTNEVGFSVGVWNDAAKVLMLWPGGRLRSTPATWGNLELSTTTVPEFEGANALILAFLTLSLVVGVFRARRSNRVSRPQALFSCCTPHRILRER